MALLALALTLAAFEIARRYVPVIPPVVTSAAVLAFALPALRISAGDYAAGTWILVALLGPAVVALAVPFHRRRAALEANVLPTLAGIVAGAVAGIVAAVWVGHALGLSDLLVRSLAPRAATAPIAAAVATALGGNAHLAVAATLAGGILGALLAPLALRLASDPHAAGLALGLSAHGFGTARATELDETAGASAATAMALNALATSLLAPLLVPLLLR
jgi:putative effector of murein hydrolase